MSGVVADVHKLGDRWRAELSVGRDTVVVNGLAGAGIAASSVVEGRRATVVGIVRRPYPGSVRSPLVGRAARSRRRRPGRRGCLGWLRHGRRLRWFERTRVRDWRHGRRCDRRRPDGRRTSTSTTLSDHVGQTVRVGGLVAELAPDGFRLDDGTAIGRVVLTGEAADYLPLIDPGDALNATGRVEVDGEEPRVVVADAAGLVRVGDLTAASAPGAAGPSPAPATADDGCGRPEPARRRPPRTRRAGVRRGRRDRRDQRPLARSSRSSAGAARDASWRSASGPVWRASRGRRWPLRRAERGPCVARAWLVPGPGVAIHARPCLTLVRDAGLSSAEFRACEAAT